MTKPIRIVLLLALIVAAVWLLFTLVFPWVSATFVDDPTMAAAGAVLALT